MRYSAAFGLAFFLAGCGPSGRYPPAYRPSFGNDSPRPKTLLILPFHDLDFENTKATFKVHYRGIFKDTFPADGEAIIMNRLACHHLRKYAQNAVVKCDESFRWKPGDVRDTLLPEPVDSRGFLRDGDSVGTFPMPAALRLDSLSAPDYILFISNVRFVTMSYGEKTERLQMTGSYALLEYRTRSILAYGRLNSYGDYGTQVTLGPVRKRTPATRRYDMRRGVWTWVLDWASVQVLRQTPFHGEKVQKYLDRFTSIW